MDNVLKNQEPQLGPNKKSADLKILNKNILLTCSLIVLIALTTILIVQQNKLQSIKNDLSLTIKNLNQEREQTAHNLLGFISATEIKKEEEYEWIKSYTYNDPRLGLEIKVPSGAIIGREPNKSSINITNPPNVNLDISVSNPHWGEENEVGLFKGFPLFFDQEVSSTTTINGKEFGVFINPHGYCDGPGCGTPYIHYKVLNDNKYYNLTFYGDAEMDEMETEILNSLKFTDSKEIK